MGEVLPVEIDERSIMKIAEEIRVANRKIEALYLKFGFSPHLAISIGYGGIADRLKEIRDDLEASVQQLSLF